jgi:hypothetical protein
MKIGHPSTEKEAVECVHGGSGTDALATMFPKSHPMWFLLVGFHQGTRFCTITSSDTGWPAHARASQQPSQWLTTTCYKEFGRNMIAGLMCVMLWVEHIMNICNVPEKKFGEFPLPSKLILFTCVILNSSNKLLKSGNILFTFHVRDIAPEGQRIQKTERTRCSKLCSGSGE